MAEDDTSPAGDDSAPRDDPRDAQILARLEQIERAVGEQSARLHAVEEFLGLEHEAAPSRPFAQGRPLEPSPAQQPAPETPARPAAPSAIPPPAETAQTESHAEEVASWRGDAHARWSEAYGEPRARAAGETQAPPAASQNASVWGELEARVGGSWFNWLGIIAVTFGVAFFLKLAFENEWIGPAGRVLLGGLAGVGLLGFAERLRARGYRSYAYVLSGGGILILYLTVYAARVFYQLIEQLPAFLLMIAVTTTAVLLAARYDAFAIAVLGLIGGFLTPALLSTGVDNQIGLFTYVALLDAGVLALAYFKSWRGLNHMAFWSTVLVFGGWLAAWYFDWKLWTTVFFLTLFFLMFSALALVHNLLRLRPARWLDVSLVISNATLYFATAYFLLAERYHALLGAHALSVAAFFVLLFYAAHTRHRADQLLALTYVGAAATFVTLAVAIQLDQYWVTIGWAVEGLLLTWIGLRSRTDPPRWAALPVFFVALLHWLTVDAAVSAYRAGMQFVPLLNRRAASAAVLVAALAGAVWLYRRAGREVERRERDLLSVALLLAANALALILLSLDVNDHFLARASLLPADALAQRAAVDNARHFALTAVWTVYAAAAFYVGLTRRVAPLRVAALLWLAVTGSKLLLADAAFYNAAWHVPLFNQTFAAFALYVAALWLALRLYARPPAEGAEERDALVPALTVAANLFALTALSLEAVGHFEKLIRVGAEAGRDTRELRLAQQLALSLVWAVYGGALLFVGYLRRNRLLRLMALGLLGLTTLKVFFLDLASLDRAYRIVSFIVLGVVLLAVSFLYQQRQQRAAERQG